MLKIMENPIKMDDLEGKPMIFGNIHQKTTPCFLFSGACNFNFPCKNLAGMRRFVSGRTFFPQTQFKSRIESKKNGEGGI